MRVPPFLPFLRKFSLGGAMKKRNLLSVVLLALCAVLVFTGCNANKAEESQGELLLIAKEKTTEFQVVNYLEEEQKVREFLADLLIKTGAKYPIVEAGAVGEHTIYIGTAAQFSDQGIATGAMSYSNYSISVENGNIYVCMGLESMAEDVLTLLKDSITKQDDGSFCFRSSSRRPTMISRIPNNFFNSVPFRTVDKKLNRRAAAHPDTIAGRILLNWRDLWRQRKTHEISAEGIKKRRFMLLAVPGSISRTKVSQRISKLPPPMPSPERNPRAVLIIRMTGMDSSIDIGHLPKGS